jgi:adenine-specific DNA-methyltransferase
MTLSELGSTPRSAADRVAMGAVYTPAALAQWVASLVSDVAERPVGTVLDPACGDGALLRAARAEIPELQAVVGVDLSEAATAAARSSLDGLRTSMVVGDALMMESVPDPAPDAVIMNPPWGAELDASAAALRKAGYTLANGQFDSWDLFVEWTVRALAPGTVVAAILPDAVFAPEHTATRRLLLERAQLQVVARLGEGWFGGVFRGVAVLVYTTGGRTHAPVRTVRIDHQARRRIFTGRSTLEAEAAGVAHQVDPAGWITHPQAVFHATASAFDSPWTSSIEARGGPWTDWFDVGRGVEMGAAGELFRCDLCGAHRGPSRETYRCRRCGRPTTWTLVEAIADRPTGDGWVQLIVGRDVRRYAVQPSRWLRTGLEGVAYKDAAVYRRPKLLVRKTGLGLNAAVDYSGAHTTQVVFHFVPRTDTPEWVLHYVEGVLCSKVMLAFHLSRTGETEWRSHPYVTPKVLTTLPVPVPDHDSSLIQALAISEAVRALREAPVHERPAREDAVDDLVAGLFSLDAQGCTWVEQALAQTQSLDAFAHLQAPRAALRSVVA